MKEPLTVEEIERQYHILSKFTPDKDVVRAIFDAALNSIPRKFDGANGLVNNGFYLGWFLGKIGIQITQWNENDGWVLADDGVALAFAPGNPTHIMPIPNIGDE